MEQVLTTQAHRSRLAQFLAWLRGDQAQTPHTQQQQSDRQGADGTMRGTEGPDTRRQATGAPLGEASGSLGDRRRIAAENRVDGTRYRVSVSQDDHGGERSRPPAEGLRAALEAAQRRFEEQQRSQDRQHGRGR